MQDHYYMLNNTRPVATNDVIEWGKWFETTDRKVAETKVIRPGKENLLVSTVFLGIDYSLGQGSALELFETMIFVDNGDFQDIYCQRSSTWTEAQTAHIMAVTEACNYKGEAVS